MRVRCEEEMRILNAELAGSPNFTCDYDSEDDGDEVLGVPKRIGSANCAQDYHNDRGTSSNEVEGPGTSYGSCLDDEEEEESEDDESEYSSDDDDMTETEYRRVMELHRIIEEGPPITPDDPRLLEIMRAVRVIRGEICKCSGNFIGADLGTFYHGRGLLRVITFDDFSEHTNLHIKCSI